MKSHNSLTQISTPWWWLLRITPNLLILELEQCEKDSNIPQTTCQGKKMKAVVEHTVQTP